MKKIFCLTLAAACALSVAALGFSACGDEDSDVVTAEEWAAAMDEANALNVTVVAAATYSGSDTYSSETTSYSGIAALEAKVALTEDESGNVTGNTYWYSAETVDEETDTETKYEVFEADSYYYVEKETWTGYDDYWDGYSVSSAHTASYSDAYYSVAMYMVAFADEYEEFEYTDGAYKYTDADENNSETYYVKINDGYISSIVIEYSYSYSDDTYSYSSEGSYTFKFYDYGTTTVTVPDEFTYAYYLEYNAS